MLPAVIVFKNGTAQGLHSSAGVVASGNAVPDAGCFNRQTAFFRKKDKEIDTHENQDETETDEEAAHGHDETVNETFGYKKTDSEYDNPQNKQNKDSDADSFSVG